MGGACHAHGWSTHRFQPIERHLNIYLSIYRLAVPLQGTQKPSRAGAHLLAAPAPNLSPGSQGGRPTRNSSWSLTVFLTLHLSLNHLLPCCSCNLARTDRNQSGAETKEERRGEEKAREKRMEDSCFAGTRTFLWMGVILCVGTLLLERGALRMTSSAIEDWETPFMHKLFGGKCGPNFL